ncbi:MAG: hypothetical protein HQK79_14885 [Desulfobacterales bacterium]|nr:hypothetical protein [Desulfobacterales bacterium]
MNFKKIISLLKKENKEKNTINEKNSDANERMMTFEELKKIHGGESDYIIVREQDINGDWKEIKIYPGSGADISVNIPDGMFDEDYNEFGYTIGTEGNDTLHATSFLESGDMPNIIYGGGGNDVIYGENNDDALYGGAGNDSINGDGGYDRLHGGEGDDRLTGGEGSDNFYFATGEGHDVITDFEPGSDKIILEGTNDDWNSLAAQYDEQANSTTIHFGTGEKMTSITVTGQNITRDQLLIWGDHTDDSICGSDGSDTFSTGIGNDTIFGGAGNDSLDGQAGNDYLDGGSGNDTLTGGDGIDIFAFTTGGGFDTINDFDPANDKIVLKGTNADWNSLTAQYDEQMDSTTIHFGTDENMTTITISGHNITHDQLLTWGSCLLGGSDADSIAGGTSDDNIYGNAGDDTLYGGAGDDILSGGMGRDVFAFTSGNGHDVINDFDAGADRIVLSGTDADWNTLTSEFNEGTHSTTIYFGTGENMTTIMVTGQNITRDQLLIWGDHTDDLISGSGSSDTLSGGIGNDTILGGAGNDTLDGGSGNDRMDGGAGTDTASYDLAKGSVNVNLSTGSAIDGEGGTDTLISIENVIGSRYDDTITGNNSANLISGGKGNDLIDGGTGTDTASYDLANGSVNVDLSAGTANDGVEGTDTLTGIENVIGSRYDDTIAGDDSANLISGDAGNDSLSGNTGNDTLYGGAGNDTLYGGSGNDRISGGTGDDIIDGGSGDDLLSGGSGNDIFVFTPDSGDKVISDFNSVSDKIILQGTTEDWNSLTTEYSEEDNNTIIRFGTEENMTTITVTGHNVTSDQLHNWRDDAVGNDTLSGSSGADVFEFTTGSGYDVIDNFNPAVDMILLKGTDADWDSLTVEYRSDINTTTIHFGTGENTTSITVHGQNITRDQLENWKFNISEGGEGNDILSGTSGNDSINGEAGDDIIDGESGDDRLTGGSGGDVFVFSTTSGNDVITDFDPGKDRIVFQGLTPSHVKTEYSPENNATTIRFEATGYNPESRATTTYSGTVVIHGCNITDDQLASWNEGWDYFSTFDTPYKQGGEGNDVIEGEAGTNNILTGGLGDDTLKGGVRNDTLSGDEGNDTADYASASGGVNVDLEHGLATDGSGGMDYIHDIENVMGSNHNDNISGDGNANILEGLDGNDTLHGRAGDDTLDGGAGNDFLTGGSGSDVFAFTTENGQDVINDFNASDKIILTGTRDDWNSLRSEYDAQTNSTTILFGAGENQTAITVNGQNISRDQLAIWAGHTYNETLSGNAGSNMIDGGLGNDSINGLTGNDTLDGGEGNDTLDGGEGNDTLDGGEGNDTLDGGEGNDTLDGGRGCDSISGGSGDDRIDGGSGNDTIDGGSGNDNITAGDFSKSKSTNPLFEERNLIRGGTGNDTITGYYGSDTLDGGDNNDNIAGNDGNDSILGGAGNDFLSGGTGDDIMKGGTGDDTLYGGSGSDIFEFNAGDGHDVIRDFNIEADKIVLKGTNADWNSMTVEYIEKTNSTTIRFGTGENVTVIEVFGHNSSSWGTQNTQNTPVIITRDQLLSWGNRNI